MRKLLALVLAAVLGVTLGTTSYLSFTPASGHDYEWVEVPDVVHGVPDDAMQFFL